MTNEIPFDRWTRVPNEELAKKGRAEFVYRPSNYPGPLAIDSTTQAKNESSSNEKYPTGAIWQDSSSYNKEDEKYDFYMMFDKWEFIGRFTHFVDAMGGAKRNDH